MSIKKLAIHTKAKRLRFFGKILGRDKDYYVAEGISSDNISDELPPNSEAKGVGVN
jgi:radial spoke head protein 4A